MIPRPASGTKAAAVPQKKYRKNILRGVDRGLMVCFIALLASSFMWNKNKWAKERTSAYGYISGTLVCDISEDRYLNTTVKKRIIEDDSNSGGSGSRSSVSHSGGGGSGRSGKF